MGLMEAMLVGAFLIPVVVATVLAVRFVRANERRAGGRDGAPGGLRDADTATVNHAALEARIARLEATIENMSRQLRGLPGTGSTPDRGDAP